MARRYEKYSKEAALIEAQSIAKTARIGLWKDDEATPPWLWRSRKKIVPASGAAHENGKSDIPVGSRLERI